MSHSMTRRQFVAGAACALAAAKLPVHAQDRPNFVLLMGDDHGWYETGYNGHPHLRTPVLDEMAASGLRLDRFYSASPVCSPTRGSVITGRHPNRYGTFGANWSIRPEEIGIARILADAGYACAHFGKWHLGPVKASSPTNPGAMGFQEWLSHDNFFEMHPQLSRNGGPPELFAGESSEVLIAEAARFIDKASRDGRPFFLVIWFGSPHEPYSGLDKDLKLYDEVARRHQDRLVTLTSMETGRPVQRPQGEVLRERYAEITAMDRAIGQLRTRLAEKGLRENTLLWYCGDNGTPSEGDAGLPLRAHKGSIYDGGVRVPGVIEWPARISKPQASSLNAVTSDILPTLCELAGRPLPSRPLDGISLKDLFDGRMRERPSPICFWDFDTSRLRQSELRPYIDPELQKGTTPLVKLMDGVATRNFRNDHHPTVSEHDLAGPRAILDNRYKLVLEASSTARELFDMVSDPAEQQNLVESRPEIAARLESRLRDWQQSVLKSLSGADYSV